MKVNVLHTALTHLTVLVHVHKAGSSQTHHHYVTSVLSVHFIQLLHLGLGAKVEWDFRISDLVKNPDGTDI